VSQNRRTLVEGNNTYRSEVLFSVYTDRTIACADCGQEFTFTAGEQEFYAQRGFTEPPKRCPSDRAIRKAQRGGSRGGSSYDSAGSGGSGGWGGGSSSSYGSYEPAYAGGPAGYSSGGSGERRQREMFEAVCADCGKIANVPFRPSGSKPVYCSDCFQNHR
jgi:CxxC-x17-CxxC domain-containing protein